MISSFFTKIIKSELRAAIALSIVLIALVGWSLADNSDATVKFDFGDNGGKAAGYISVGGSMYPTADLGLEHGWLDPVIIKSHGNAVADLRLRDANVGIDPAKFKVSGLTHTLYNAEIISGDFVDNMATKVSYAGQNYLIRSNPGEWNHVILSVTPVDGVVEIDFSRIGTAENLWAVNAIVLTATDTALSKPVFDMVIQPTAHVVYASGQAVYRIGISSPNSYASQVNLSIADLTPSITAQITPAQGLAPFTADLRLTTTPATPATIYNFTILAQGEDIDKSTVSKKITLTVTSSERDTTQNPNIDIPQSLESTMKEMRASQLRIELLKELQEMRLADASQLKDLDDLVFSGVIPMLGELPAPEGGVGSALLYMTRAGIINSVVDYAPPAGDDQTPPTGFWSKFFGSVSNPVR
ncbi:hypothetical protein KKE14_02315 [Patescibacteria group bacterium]|nr:hypothetical protein [Patescibacteria group bacterium]